MKFYMTKFYLGAFIAIALPPSAQALAQADALFTTECDKYGPVMMENVSFSSVLSPNKADTKSPEVKGPAFANTDAVLKDIPHFSYETMGMPQGKNNPDSCLGKEKEILSDLQFGKSPYSAKYKELVKWFQSQIDPRNTTEYKAKLHDAKKVDQSLVDFFPWIQLVDNRSGVIPQKSPLLFEQAFISEEMTNSCTLKFYHTDQEIDQNQGPYSQATFQAKTVFMVINPILTKTDCQVVSAENIVIMMKHWKTEIDQGKWKPVTSQSQTTK